MWLSHFYSATLPKVKENDVIYYIRNFKLALGASGFLIISVEANDDLVMSKCVVLFVFVFISDSAPCEAV